MTSATSSTRSQTDELPRAFATLRVSGDDLVPNEITEVFKIRPTKAYAKGEHYSSGPRSPDLIGRTGVWYFATDDVVAGNNLTDHLAFLTRLLRSGSGEADALSQLQQLMRRRSLRVSVACFWHGPAGAKKPPIPRSVTELLKQIPAGFETDFDVEEKEGRHAA
jgi:hypothetical protein